MKWKKSRPQYFKGTSQKADEAAGIIRDIVIIQEFVGEDRDAYGDNFDETSLQQFIVQGNAQEQGVKSRFGHPNMCDTTLGSYLGRMKNFRLSKNSDGKKVVLADLHLAPIAKDAPSRGNIHDYVLNMSKMEADMFGNSVVYEPAEPEAIQEKDGEGNDVTNYYQRVKAFLASDMVDSPAATENLFKDTESLDLGIEVSNFLDDHPQIFELIRKDESVIEKFFIKYFLSNKDTPKMAKEKATKTVKDLKQKSKAAKLKEEINSLIDSTTGEETKGFDATTSGGKTITISDEDGDGQPGTGDKVTDTTTGEPVAAASTELTDGTVIVTDDAGIITEIKPAETQTPAESEAATVDTSKEVSRLTGIITAKDKRIKELEDQLAENEGELEEVQAQFDKLKEKLAKSKGTFVPKSGEQNFSKEDAKTERDLKKEKEERRAQYRKKDASPILQ